MKMLKRTKKGFTLVELIVVIAIIAILSAVSVVSYIAFINSANTSADQQAVTQMNRILMADSILNEDSNIYDLYDVLEINGLTAKDYKPLISNRYFFWDKKENRIVYTDEDYQVLYPADLADATKDDGWYSLTNEITKVDYTVEEGTSTVTITEAGQFTKLAEDLKNGNEDFANANGVVTDKIYGASGVNLTIKLPKTLDLMGASFNFCGINCNITIEGATGGSVIKGIVNGRNFEEAKNKEGSNSKYGAGLLGYVANSNVTIKDVTFEDCYFGNKHMDLSGSGIVGYFTSKETTKPSVLTFDNVHANRNTYAGSHGIGGLLGRAEAKIGTKTQVKFLNSNSVKNCEIYSTEYNENEYSFGWCGGVIGEISAFNTSSSVDIFGANNLSVENNVMTKLNGTSGATYFNFRDYNSNTKASGETQINSIEYNNYTFSGNSYSEITNNSSNPVEGN